ncbi:MAG: PorP/SprF family type IX secretion system membrane protein [Chitinophagales bacterium]
MRKILSIASLLVCALVASAQDIHFSQFFAAPLQINPANTGNFNGIVRIGGNYRDQWSSFTVPYRTFNVYTDAAIQPKKAVNRFGLGISAYNDQAGDGDLTTTKANLSAAYHIGYTDHTYFRMAFGLSGGIVQKKVNINKLVFDSQWNDFTFDPDLPNNEPDVIETIQYADVAAGTMMTFTPNEGERYAFGFSASHINTPNETFFNADNKVGIRYTLTGAGQFATAGIANIQPQFFVSTQDNALEIIAGTNVSFLMNMEESTSKAVFIGAWYRHTDAVWMVGGAQLDNLTFSFSYDFNISPLRTASRSFGGLELAVVYIFNNKEKLDPLKCPAYQ